MIVDLSGLTFADPSLMIDLACLAQRLRARGVTLWLAHPQPNIRTLIETVGLHRLPAVRIDGAEARRSRKLALERVERARERVRQLAAPEHAHHEPARPARGLLHRPQRDPCPRAVGVQLDREVRRGGEARRRLAVQPLGEMAPGELALRARTR